MLALTMDQHGQTPTEWQLTRYPDWAQRRIRVIREGARLELCKPQSGAAPSGVRDRRRSAWRRTRSW